MLTRFGQNLASGEEICNQESIRLLCMNIVIRTNDGNVEFREHGGHTGLIVVAYPCFEDERSFIIISAEGETMIIVIFVGLDDGYLTMVTIGCLCVETFLI